MESTKENLNTESLKDSFLIEFKKNPLDLSEIEKLLQKQKLHSLSNDKGRVFIDALIRCMPANQNELVKELVKLWLEKAAENNAAEVLLSEAFNGFSYGEEGVRYAMVTTLIEAGASARTKIFEGGIPEFKSIMHKALCGFYPSCYADFRTDIELLHYLLAKGAGPDLITTIKGNIYSYNLDDLETSRQVPELITLLKIAQEDSIKSGRELTEADGQKIAMCYLYCTKEGISAELINKNKDWVLEFLLSPLSLQCLAASTIKRHTPQENIDKLPLPNVLKTFVEEVAVAPLKDQEAEKNSGGAAGSSY